MKPDHHGRDHLEDGEDPIPGIGGPRRIVRGSMYSDASTVDSGTGDWTAAVTGNIITITIDPPFDSIPSVAVQPAGTLEPWDGTDPNPTGPAPVGGQSGFSRVYIATDKIGVVWWDKDGVLLEGGGVDFCFIAVGT